MYEINLRLPRLRMEAVRMVREGYGVREAARHFGYSPGAVSKWVVRANDLSSNARVIPTRSSRPHHHPEELSGEVVEAILAYRARHQRCAKVLHHLLGKDGIAVSLSSVERTLRRAGLVNHSRWKKWHQYPVRPLPEKPGLLVQIDTILDGVPADRLCAYTLLDVCSRWAYAVPCVRTNTHQSLRFVEEARGKAPFDFLTLQSDHGSEFSKWFTKRIVERGMAHRHSRVRTPNDNAHLERFNRTLQEECFARIPRNLAVWRKEIPEYLHFYNTERPHMGLGMQSPTDILKVFPRY